MTRRTRGPAITTGALLGALAALGWWAYQRFTRYEVTGESMAPALNPGDWLLVDSRAYAHRAPRRRHLVLARDPRQRSRTLLKRVLRTDLHGEVQLEGDNANASTDSRSFGPVAREAILGRVRWRYWPPGAIGRVS